MTGLILKITFLMVIFNFCASSDLAATLYELQKTPDDMKNDRMSAEEEANQPTTDKPTTVPNPPTSTVKAVTEKVLEKAKNSQKQKSRKDKQKLILEETNTLPINPKMPINIGVRLVLESIKSIDVDAFMDFYMEVTWYDHRERNLTAFMSGKDTNKFCWMPDLYFLLARSVNFIENTQYLGINKGEMLYDRKISIKTPCVPDPFRYPFDTVTCTVLVSSYGYDEGSVRLFWKDGGLEFPETYDQLEYIGFKWAGNHAMFTGSESVQYGTYNYTILMATFQFQRLYSVYLYQIIIPAAILVIISWTVFWININVTPARVGIGVTAILSLLTLSTNRKHDANSKYLTIRTSLLDIYIWSCFLFVILAYIEVSASDYMITGKPKTIGLGRENKVSGKLMTVKSRSWVPLGFLMFNAAYWFYAFSV